MPGLLGLLDLIAAPSPEQARGLLSDLVAAPRNRLRGLLSDPSGFLQSALSDVVPTDQQAQEQLARYRMPASQDYAMGPSGYDNKMRDIALGALTVYHGSPHKFDKFDMSKIGTGEGAQAYGHGLYMSETPAVAKNYAEKLSSAGLSRTKLSQSGGDIDAAIEGARNSIKNYQDIIAKGGGGDPRRANGMLSLAEKNLRDLLAMKNGTLDEAGNLYKVDIPDEAVARMLDWDKPLSQQAPEVQKALNGMRNLEGSQLHSMLIHKYGSPDKVNDFLRQQGIPGIRYLDGGSRNAGKGTYNYVVFDDALPTILERNGQKLK